MEWEYRPGFSLPKEPPTSIRIPEGVTHLEDDPFQVRGVCSRNYFSMHVESVILPSTLMSIGKNTFRGFRLLKSIEFPEGLQSIGELAFHHSGLLHVRIPDSVRTIGEGAFRECESLESIVLPEGLKIIDEDTFFRCVELKTIKFPNRLESVGRCAFTGSGFKSIELPEGLLSIDESAFSVCCELERVRIPASVLYVCADAFSDCDSLEKVVFEGTPLYVGERAFTRDPAFFTDETASMRPRSIVLRGSSDRLLARSIETGEPYGEMLDGGEFQSCRTSESLASHVSAILVNMDDDIDIEAKAGELADASLDTIRNRQPEFQKGEGSCSLVEYMLLTLEAEKNVLEASRCCAELAYLQTRVAASLPTTLRWLEIVAGANEKQVDSLKSECDAVLGTPDEGAVHFYETYGNAARPAPPDPPSPPVLQAPGLFNKKKVERANRALEEGYKTELEAHEKLVRELAASFESEAIDYLRDAREELPAALERARKTTDEREAQRRMLTALPELLSAEASAAGSELTRAVELRHALYSQGILFEKYQNLPAVSTMLEYLQSGRCTALEGEAGAYNLYESELRANRIIAQLDDIQNSLEEVKRNQFLLFKAVNDVNAAMNRTRTELLDEMGKLGSDLKGIRDSSAAAAHFAKKNAEIAAQGKTLFGIAF